MEVVYHIVGVCSDTHTHIDLIDILLYGSGLSTTIYFFKLKIIMLWKKIIKKQP